MVAYCDGKIWHAWEGGPGNYIGEHMWIGEDIRLSSERRALEDNEHDSTVADIAGSSTDTIYEPNINHIIIGISSKSTQDTLDHINFFKVIELANGTRYVFEYALDVIKTTLGPR